MTTTSTVVADFEARIVALSAPKTQPSSFHAGVQLGKWAVVDGDETYVFDGSCLKKKETVSVETQTDPIETQTGKKACCVIM